MDRDELAAMGVVELRKMAATRMIPGRSEMNKSQLIAALAEYTLEERVRRLEGRVSALEQKGWDQDIDHVRLGGTR
jgi:hypothetical protein